MYRRHRKTESTRELAKSAYRIASKALKEEDCSPEVKFFDIKVQNNSVSSTGTTPAILNDPVQGMTDNQRIGDSIKNLNLTIRWWWALATISYAHVRLVIYWDESNTNSAVGTVLSDTSAVYGITSPKFWDNRFDSHILYDKTVELTSPEGTAGNISRVYKKTIKIDKHTQFNAGTATISTGALRYFFISDSAVVNSCLANFYFRLTYCDS